MKNVTKDDLDGAYSSPKTKPRLMTLQKQKSKKDGTVMIYVELSIDDRLKKKERKFKRVPTGIRVLPEQWSKAKEEIKQSHPAHVQLNRTLQEHLNSVQFYMHGKFVNEAYNKGLPSEMKTFEKYFDKSNRKTLISYLEDYIVYRQSDSVRGTWKEFRTLKGRLDRYEKHFNETLFFETIDFDFSEKLKTWSKTANLNPNTVKKTFDALSTFLTNYVNDQKKLGFTLSLDYREKKFSKVSGTHSQDPTPLYFDELKRIIDFIPTDPIEYTKIQKGKPVKLFLTVNAQYKIKSLFILACSTGLRYGDLTSLKKSNFVGNTIKVRASKTDNNKSSKTLFIPIVPIADQILKEIGYDMSKIKLSNQKANDYLTVILRQLNIDTPTIKYEYSLNGDRKEIEIPKYDIITFHSGRDTFITNCLIAGVDVTTVMSWSGHSKYDTFKKYIKLSEEYLKTQHVKVNNLFVFNEEEEMQKLGIRRID